MVDVGNRPIKIGDTPRENYDKLRVKASVECLTECFIALTRFLLTSTSLELDPARGGTHSGGKIEMDERRLDGDETTNIVRITRGEDRGQGACLSDFDLRDVRFHIIEALLLEQPSVGVARGDTVFEEGYRVIVKAGKRSELLDERARRLTNAKATSDEHTSDPGAEELCTHEPPALAKRNDPRLNIGEVEFHRPLAPVFYLHFRIQKRLHPADIHMTRNGEVKDDGVGNRLALVDHFLVVHFILILLAPPPCRSGIVPRSIRRVGGSRRGSSASGAHLDVAIDIGNQAMCIGIRDALVGTIDEHTRGDMANPDVRIVVDAVFANERNEDGARHGLAIRASRRGVDLHGRDANPMTTRFCDSDQHMKYGG